LRKLILITAESDDCKCVLVCACVKILAKQRDNDETAFTKWITYKQLLHVQIYYFTTTVPVFKK